MHSTLNPCHFSEKTLFRFKPHKFSFREIWCFPIIFDNKWTRLTRLVPDSYQLGTSWYQLVPACYQLVPAGASLVPAGTKLLPACTSLVPASTSLVPASTSWCSRSLEASREPPLASRPVLGCPLRNNEIINWKLFGFWVRSASSFDISSHLKGGCELRTFHWVCEIRACELCVTEPRGSLSP